MDSMDVDAMDDIRVSVICPPQNSPSKLMVWLNSIDILKHVTESHLGDMFVDGELFEEEGVIENADHLAEEILPSENYFERLLNWRIINDKILENLKIARSSWFLEYLAKGNIEYIANLLNSLREIAPVQQPRYVERDVVTHLPPSQRSSPFISSSCNTTADTDYYNDMIYKAKRANRNSSRRPSPFPRSRMAIAKERVIWGGPRYFQSTSRHQRQDSSSQQRKTPRQYQKQVSTYRNPNYRFYEKSKPNRTQFKAERSRSRSRSYDRFRYEEEQAPVETYCFLQRRLKKRWNNSMQAMKRRLGVRKRPVPYIKQEKVSVVNEDVDKRFRQLLHKYSAKPYTYDERKGFLKRGYEFSRYLYRYYTQYDYELCNFCNVEEQDEVEVDC